MIVLNKTDFFQEQTVQCRALAARAANKTDREFWLRLACRWEELLQRGGAGLEADKSLASSVRYSETKHCQKVCKMAGRLAPKALHVVPLVPPASSVSCSAKMRREGLQRTSPSCRTYCARLSRRR
jgi:hypothetical protein